ncbi:Na+/H+ antiporter subunit G [Roseobacter denitrificans]|uniref:Putative potassium efflux system protein n=1 Tax=Roseobacter denitrificans (strain ATCC 33942 / OCh 114) TaxID=375451 RepID=Q162R5_ROSDO|nr:Na+/H+ antiporter subunit G [Roseobacter denitrificans]ABG33028.1 putative potassium efflux system protein [Roseobacter denitrificans OCh 114]AVL52405.1 Na+/H+ antiporter subunit G [Roseobacter denitrificans]SFG09251.1 multisubunit potassium/proton antiporter, PhaG subunit [Roseobacter denitrificans OCh 114]
MSLEVIELYITVAFLLIGAVFTMVAAIGLLKLGDPMTRLHAPTKAATLGIGSFLLASMSYSFATSEGSFHEVLILAFLFVTAPISANFIAKVNIHKRSCDMPQAPTKDEMWSTMDVPETDRDIEVQTNP